MHSQRFLAIMNDDSKAATTAANLAELVKEPEQYVRNCIEQRGKRPPALVWGFDLWRALVLSRNCFSADLISEHQAWRDILKTARYAHGLFGSLDEFITNYRLGNAFWLNDFSVARDRLAAHKLYQKKCRWPIKSVVWPDVSEDELSRHSPDRSSQGQIVQ